ncbi:hypothetical protein MT356_16460 [Rathayibacter festucae]|uniref:Uncharacterized protein n=1 Tax=Rathayibacter festucae TaxID=110937 RepID=A0ABX6GWP5_9MICO|nr:hypothetical protein [Rathayibacter festucae]MCJ1701303.1 hypothetical protein [Rathayibacter festucae]QHC61934.1 hypothetical protein GSU69_03990 [Rathayibacter festucae]
MKRSTRIASIAGAVLLSVGMAATAQANVFADSFDKNAGGFQSPTSTTYQTKYESNRNGTIQLREIGSDYKMDAQMCQALVNCDKGTKIFSITDDNVVHGLPNSYEAGTETLTSALRTTPFTIYQVHVRGQWQAW